MSEKTAARTREKWVDDVKVIACILVVLGHFFQSMTKSNILPENGLYQWFNTTIYYFHVPLFFICSGYLYQKYSKVNSVGSWCKNVAKKALALGVPYATFTTATWVLKKVFSSSVNDQIGGLGDTLFLHPTAPYWYLYALFFIFLVTPTFSDVKAAAIGLIVALAAKVLILTGGGVQHLRCIDGSLKRNLVCARYGYLHVYCADEGQKSTRDDIRVAVYNSEHCGIYGGN